MNIALWLVQVLLAAGLHLNLGQANMLPVNFILGGLAAFVAWGRLEKLPQGQ